MYTRLASQIAASASLELKDVSPHQGGLSGFLMQSCGLVGSPGPSRLEGKGDLARWERGKDIQDRAGMGGNSLFEALE